MSAVGPSIATKKEMLLLTKLLRLKADPRMGRNTARRQSKQAAMQRGIGCQYLFLSKEACTDLLYSASHAQWRKHISMRTMHHARMQRPYGRGSISRTEEWVCLSTNLNLDSEPETRNPEKHVFFFRVTVHHKVQKSSKKKLTYLLCSMNKQKAISQREGEEMQYASLPQPILRY